MAIVLIVVFLFFLLLGWLWNIGEKARVQRNWRWRAEERLKWEKKRKGQDIDRGRH